MSKPKPQVDAKFVGAGKQRGVQIWRVNKFAVEDVPKGHYGNFYTGDSYIVLNTKAAGEWDVHFWLGAGTSQDEMGTAAIKTVELDDSLGGLPVQYREIQGHESALFLSYFKDGIKYLDGGVSTGFHHVVDPYENYKPKLFHCKGKRNVRCAQVKCAKESLNRGDVFILDRGTELYVWMPPEAGRLERIKGMQQAKSIRDKERAGRPQIHVLDQNWNTSSEFWREFGGVQNIEWIKSAQAGGKDDDFWRENRQKIALYRVSDASGKLVVSKVHEGGLSASLLDSTDAFIVDTVGGGLFVWVGKGCTGEERRRAMDWGQQYIAQNKLPRNSQIVRVLEGAEPDAFTQWFGNWKEAAKGGVAFQPKLYQCSNETGQLHVEEIANFYQEDLDGDDVMILDALNTVYVWIGNGANNAERDAAQQTAKNYLAGRGCGVAGRHKAQPAVEVLHQGRESPPFKKLFPAWDDRLFARDNRSVENMRRLLFVK